MPAKLLLLGIDAASPLLVERWTADGTLPHLAALARTGLMGRTRSIEGFHIGATWPCFQSGETPAGHGHHYTVQLRPGSYAFHEPLRDQPARFIPFWTHLRRRGRRVAVLDVPLSRPEVVSTDLQVVEWGSHDAVFGFHAAPAPAEQEIRVRFGAHPPGRNCDAARRTPRDYARFTEALLCGVRAKAGLTRHFLGQQDWDLFLQVFTEAHCAGHQCWHLHDEAHPAYDAAAVRAAGDPLRRVYTAIDAAIGDVLAHAGATRVIVFSLHGMAHSFGTQFLLREILVRLGCAQPAANTSTVATPTASLVRRAWRALPGPVRRRLAPLRSRAGVAQPATARPAPPALGVDTATSRCFVVPNGLACGGIRLNLRGREPTGVLNPDEADAFVAELESALLSLREEKTNLSVVRRVRRTRDLYSGERGDELPDVLVEWHDAIVPGSTNIGAGRGAVVRLHSPRTGTIEGANEWSRSGEHRPEGFIIASGPGVGPGRLERAVSVLDFAPTLLAVSGVPLPECAGRVVPELLAALQQP
jgi:predicted AlkP superfamily phosphohydrolase/phosphomutase